MNLKLAAFVSDTLVCCGVRHPLSNYGADRDDEWGWREERGRRGNHAEGAEKVGQF